jgi:hypothetical protein
LLGKLPILKADDKFDEASDIGKNSSRTVDLNEIFYTEIIVSIDIKTLYGKIGFNIVKEYKINDYLNGNTVTSWEKLKNKYEPVFVPSMFKLDKQFRDSSLEIHL